MDGYVADTQKEFDYTFLTQKHYYLLWSSQAQLTHPNTAQINIQWAHVDTAPKLNTD